MQLPDTKGMPCVYQTSFISEGVLLGSHGSRLGFVTPFDGEVSLGPLSNTTSQEACKKSD